MINYIDFGRLLSLCSLSFIALCSYSYITRSLWASIAALIRTNRCHSDILSFHMNDVMLKTREEIKRSL